ncbi:hypothetical protein BKA62DRAFT_693590 [Auriculariales sp. MPI-PUGE-AT-0066]|nr:hypothetical protein BKA62DRAFT_693590 [Auriculariales sp. MPI-PUGE-AT-0066]
MTSNYVSTIAIVGVGGHSGRYMTEALLATGKHVVTALTRLGSTSSLPTGIKSVTVDYTDKDGLVAALRGQDVLIITLSVNVVEVAHPILVEAAAAAGVSWILPNSFGPDTSGTIDSGVFEDVPFFATQPAQREHILSLGRSSFIDISTGFWYEWSVAMPRFGFNFAERTATLFDDGETKMSLSTWPQVGRAIASLLSLPIASEDGPSLNSYRNKIVYINSFTVTQHEILERQRDDWTVDYVPSSEMLARGREALKTGDMSGFVLQIYARFFYPLLELGNTEKTHGTINTALGLTKDDIDEATRAAIARAKEVKPYGAA